MVKLVVAGSIVVAFAAYVLHPHGASAAKVASCLEKHGATARPSTFFEEAFGMPADGEQIPELLVERKREHQDMRPAALAAAQGFDITPQSHGKVVMLWFGGPAAESQSRVERCF